MIHLLTRLPKVERQAALLSLAVGIVLLCVKFTAYFLTGSTAIFADALEGIVNVTASGFALYALVMAHRPADSEHPYGHGKIEFFSAGFEGGMILLAAAVAVVKAVEMLVWPQPLHVAELGLGLVLMLLALLVNALVGTRLIRAGTQQSSVTLQADGWHLITDAITSAAAVIAIVLVWSTHWGLADPLIALLVSIYIGATGIRLMRQSAAGLMDEQDAADDLMLRQILDSHVGLTGKPPRICSYHKLRHRHSGRYHWVDFHLVMPGKVDIQTGHQTATEIEDEIEAALGEGNATAHLEPCHVPECPVCQEDRRLISTET